jgi:pimeloyl-ACP methyl ester carboxylesterase
MGKVQSADGTTIAFDAWRGPTADHGRRRDQPSGCLTAQCTGWSTVGRGVPGLLLRPPRPWRERRHRPYAVEREIEDLAALIADAGAPAFVCGLSSGGVLALHAAAGLPITRLALFEPPFVVDASRPPLPADYVARLDGYVAGGRQERRRGAVPHHRVRDAGGGRRRGAAEPVLACYRGGRPHHRLRRPHHGTTMSGRPLPTDRWSNVRVPTLVLYGRGTAPSLISAARALADLLPTAALQAVEGEQHNVAAEVLAPVLRRFAAGEPAAGDVQ